MAKPGNSSLSGLTTPLISGLTMSSNGALFAGSLDAGLFVSLDFGKTWQKGKPSYDVEGTVTGMVTSPNFEHDGTAFAALDGGAVMVTRNNGKTWEDASFGLSSTTVFAIAVSPDWSRYETVWASTEAGVYVSRNGGRAWRATNLVQSDIVDALAVSPAFMEDQTLFAGTESGALHVSTDGGRNWTQLQEQLADGPINCLWLAPDFGDSGTMLAGVGTSLYLSMDRGVTWEKAAELPGAVLSLSGNRQVVLAGLHEAGVFVSEDGGRSWAATPGGVVARGFSRLEAAGDMLYVMGPQEGVYFSQDQGTTWNPLPGLDDYLPVTSMHVTSDGSVFVASHDAGILQLASSRRSWRVRSEQQGVSTLALAPDEGLGWAGTADGRFLVTKDGGTTWAISEEAPSRGQAMLTIKVSPTFGDDHTLYVGTAVAATRRTKGKVLLWRSRNRGRTWHQVTTQETESQWMDITMPVGVAENVADQAVLATGPYCLRPLRKAKDVWISTVVDPEGANVLNLAAIGEIDEGAVLFAATGSGVFRSTDGGRTWHAFSDGIEGKSVVSLALTGEGDQHTLFALSLGGLLAKCSLG
jgi:photosystem II stability/assembly factor-like uncharacterized protein